jgi:hypothetical protein
MGKLTVEQKEPCARQLSTNYRVARRVPIEQALARRFLGLHSLNRTLSPGCCCPGLLFERQAFASPFGGDNVELFPAVFTLALIFAVCCLAVARILSERSER